MAWRALLPGRRPGCGKEDNSQDKFVPIRKGSGGDASRARLEKDPGVVLLIDKRCILKAAVAYNSDGDKRSSQR